MIEKWVGITPNSVMLQGEPFTMNSVGHSLLVELYRSRINDYPKFFKMDALCQLGFVASELLLKEESPLSEEENDSRAILFFNQSSSLNADTNFQATIQSAENYYPSPSVFVYTLPNIVTGEIAIRNKYYGETSFFVVNQFDTAQMAAQFASLLPDSSVHTVLGGWLNCKNENDFEALVFLLDVTRGDEATLANEINNIRKQFNL